METCSTRWLMGALITLALSAAANAADKAADAAAPVGPPIHAVLTSPPEVRPATHRTQPAKVIVELEIRELQKEISEGVYYTFWTFGGTGTARPAGAAN